MIQRSLMSVVLMGCTIPHVFTSAQSSNNGDLLQGNFQVVFINGTATLVRTLEPEKVLEKVNYKDESSFQSLLINKFSSYYQFVNAVTI